MFVEDRYVFIRVFLIKIRKSEGNIIHSQNPIYFVEYQSKDFISKLIKFNFEYKINQSDF